MNKRIWGRAPLIGLLCLLSMTMKGYGWTPRSAEVDRGGATSSPVSAERLANIETNDINPVHILELKNLIISAQTVAGSPPTVGGSYFQDHFTLLYDVGLAIHYHTLLNAPPTLQLLPNVAFGGPYSPITAYNGALMTTLTASVVVRGTPVNVFTNVGLMNGHLGVGDLNPSSGIFNPAVGIPDVVASLNAVGNPNTGLLQGYKSQLGAFAQKCVDANNNTGAGGFVPSVGAYNPTDINTILSLSGPSNGDPGIADYVTLQVDITNFWRRMVNYVKAYGFQKVVNDPANATIVSGLLEAISVGGDPTNPAYASNFCQFFDLIRREWGNPVYFGMRNPEPPQAPPYPVQDLLDYEVGGSFYLTYLATNSV